MSDEQRNKVSPYVAGITCKCPSCGKGKLFRSYIDVEPVCKTCGFDLKSIDSGDGPAVFVILIVGLIVVALAFWMEFTFHPPYWLQLTIWLPTILILSLGLLRPLKSLMIALQYYHKASSDIELQ
ncbi:DUF983 domain-containing protein [Sneathiella sp. P13V-1]|nr:DUF983 domain-containing protein [Sneathiella sp. P13V-1]